MDEQNPYGTPEATLYRAVPPPFPNQLELASPWVRLAAAILDGLIALAINLPLMIVGGFLKASFEAGLRGQQVPFSLTLMWTGVGLLVFLVVQTYPLHRWGQTWGKRLAGVQIVRMDGSQADLGQILLKRYLPIWVVGLVPYLGGLLMLVDSLFIFREDRRCVHDLIAGTQVIVRRPQ